MFNHLLSYARTIRKITHTESQPTHNNILSVKKELNGNTSRDATEERFPGIQGQQAVFQLRALENDGSCILSIIEILSYLFVCVHVVFSWMFLMV